MAQALRLCIVIVGAVLLFAGVRVYAARASVDLKIVVNADNAVVVEAGDLASYFLLKRRRWSNGASIILFNAPRTTEQRWAFDEAILGFTPDQSAHYWLDQRIRAGVISPRESGGDAVTIKLVSHLKNAIGYVSASTNTATVRVIARVHDGELLVP